MKGFLWKDYLTIRKKYGLPRLVLDLAIVAALLILLEGTGALVVSLVLVPLEVTSMVVSLTSFDETWKWEKYAVALPVSKGEIVKSRYAFSLAHDPGGVWGGPGQANLIAWAAFGAGGLKSCLLLAVGSFFLTLLVLAVLFPSNYRLGVNAGVAGDDPVPGGHPGPVVLGQGHGVRMAGFGRPPMLSLPCWGAAL